MAPDTLFVVRCHDPTEAALRRWLNYFERLQFRFNEPDHPCWAATDGGVALALSVDTTNQTTAQRARLRDFSRTAADYENSIFVHRYNENDMKKAFPGLRECERKLDAEDKLQKEIKKGRSLAWGFHAEALILCVRAVRRALRVEAFKHVWCSEDDVGINGYGAHGLVEKYLDNSADLIGGRCKRQPVEPEWWWKNVGTDSFFRYVPPSSRLFCEEHVQRYSGKLLRVAEHFMVSSSFSAWSESFWPSFVDAHPDLTFEPLGTTCGTPYCWNGNVTEEQWMYEKGFCYNGVTVYHALRF